MAKLSKISEAIDFESMFGNDDFKRNTVVSRGKPQSKSKTLMLYRGFDVDVDKLKKDGQHLILSPEKSEQGLIWFTHELISGYSPIEYVKGRGSHILQYPLKCVQHYQEIQWSDGSISTRIPDEILDATNPYENCKLHMGIELPEGWVFSYKTEKFIGCSVKLKILPEMLIPNDQL